MELDSLYQEVILDHYKKPHHKGLPTGEIQVHHVNPNCGDEITLSLAIRDAQIALQEFTEMMQSKGKYQGKEEILEDAVALAGVSKFPARVKCALLGWMAFKDAAIQNGAEL